MNPSLKQRLDEIIVRFSLGYLSYSAARIKIDEMVNLEVERIIALKDDGFMYKKIISLQEAKTNAFNRLDRKKKRLDMFP